MNESIKKIETMNLPQRPKINPNFRSQNSIIKLQSNLLQMRFNPNQNHTRQFSIKITPELPEDSYQLFRIILRNISKELKSHFKNYLISGKSLFSSFNSDNSLISFKTNVDEIDYLIEISITKNLIDLSHVTEINKENIQIKTLIERIIKIIFDANDGFIRFDGGNYFNFKNYTEIEGKAKKLFGYSTGCHITDSGLYLRITDRNKFISGKTAYEKLKEIWNNCHSHDPKKICIEYFEGKSVLTNYGNLKVYKIETVSFDKKPINTIISIKNKNNDYVEVPLINYYKEKYSININVKDQPLLIVSEGKKNNENLNENRRYLIPELVYLCGIDENNDNLNLRRKMAKKLNPVERMEKIKEVNKLLVNTKHKYFKKANSSDKIQLDSPNEVRQNWGLEFGNFQTFQGRILQKPEISFGQNEKMNNDNFKNDGKFSQKIFYRSINLNSNLWIILTSKYHNGEKAVDNLMRCSRQMGINIQKPLIKEIKERNAQNFINELRYIDLNQGKKIVLIILDKYTKHCYGSIKNYLCEQIGITSQCILWEKAETQNLSYWSNILKQMETKLGAQPFDIKVHQEFKDKRSMIIGIVISKIGKKNIRIIMTSSYSKGLCNFYTQNKECTFEDKSSQIYKMTMNAITYFKNIYNNNTPTYIIFFRLGGNEKQTEKIYQEEVTILKDFFSEKNTFFEKKEEIPKWSFISINKKPELKFFQITEGKNLSNPSSGTVIDTEVTNRNYYEFYLQPQYVNMGTATPVHYHCLYDSIGIPIEDMENISYNLTYYYWNWSGPIREPAPLKFADTCNTFIGKIKIGDNVNEKIKNTPYYI